MEAYRLVTTRKGLVPINEIKEGTEVLSLGEWKAAPKPVKGICLECHFETLPVTIFEKTFVNFKREVSICHINVVPETSNKSLFFNVSTMYYWYPRFLKYYGNCKLPEITAVGYNLRHKNAPVSLLEGEDLTERNLEYVLEGMLRKSFSYTNGKYNLMQSMNETHKLVLRLLDIECDVHQNGYTVVRNPISLYRHIKDPYNKARIKDEDIVFNLKRSGFLPDYTSGHRIIRKKEIEDWILPGINPDINTINPVNCYETGFTRMAKIYSDKDFNSQHVENDINSYIYSHSNINSVDVEST